ncbi:Uncharacterised protein [Mycobacteroides abscessus subsp. abscessus]|uniref:hypothetical protein n=1 Tax=Mycobacteroides abscessus TaxID=36809 RepID=UPI0009293EDF|nr:hypothetical protein [Mycobacteroides abscessus]SHS18209.1 Uncharacterised protein [Mycobacteroides abscessus subsp. abscessus]
MSQTTSSPAQGSWLSILLSGQPHQVIGEDPRDPYLRRWFLWPRNRFVNLYGHLFEHSDPPPIHNHPWPFLTIVVKGSYLEVTRTGVIERRAGSVAFRRSQHSHRIMLPTDAEGHDIPCITVVLTGPRRRHWGFWCPGSTKTDEERFVPWEQFGSRGCGEPHPGKEIQT